MLAELKFVQGAVSKKSLVPALTHFAIENGTVRGFNGRIALSSPIPFDIACKPKAIELVKAIGNCTDVVKLSLTPAGRLRIASGSFKAFVDCIEGETPHATPSGERYEVDGEMLLAGLRAVAPFIGDDASRPWCNGVLLRGPSLFATNNVTLVEYWAGVELLPLEVNLPHDAIKELLRIGEAPVGIQMDANSVTFHYVGRKWVRAQLLATTWPDLARVLDRGVENPPVPIDPRLAEALTTLKPFADKVGRVLFQPTGLATHAQDGEGAAYDIDGWPYTGIYNIEMLELVAATATTVDFTSYPKPCLFFGDRLRGAIIGMRG